MATVPFRVVKQDGWQGYLCWIRKQKYLDKKEHHSALRTPQQEEAEALPNSPFHGVVNKLSLFLIKCLSKLRISKSFRMSLSLAMLLSWLGLFVLDTHIKFHKMTRRVNFSSHIVCVFPCRLLYQSLRFLCKVSSCPCFNIRFLESHSLCLQLEKSLFLFSCWIRLKHDRLRKVLVPKQSNWSRKDSAAYPIILFLL